MRKENAISVHPCLYGCCFSSSPRMRPACLRSWSALKVDTNRLSAVSSIWGNHGYGDWLVKNTAELPVCLSVEHIKVLEDGTRRNGWRDYNLRDYRHFIVTGLFGGRFHLAELGNVGGQKELANKMVHNIFTTDFKRLNFYGPKLYKIYYSCTDLYIAKCSTLEDVQFFVFC